MISEGDRGQDEITRGVPESHLAGSTLAGVVRETLACKGMMQNKLVPFPTLTMEGLGQPLV